MIISAALSAADEIYVAVAVAGFSFLFIFIFGPFAFLVCCHLLTQQVAIIADVFVFCFCIAAAIAELITAFYSFLCMCIHFAGLWVKSSHRTMHGVNVILLCCSAALFLCACACVRVRVSLVCSNICLRWYGKCNRNKRKRCRFTLPHNF